MSARDEILRLEERLRQADLSSEPDTSAVLEELLADDLMMVGPKGQLVTKAFIVDAHKPPRKQPFTKVELTDIQIRDQGDTVLLTCLGHYDGPAQFSLRFLRVWSRAAGRWRVVGGSVSPL